MIAQFIKILPYVFVLYFLYRAIKDPVFFMGIPFLMFFRSSIFFEKALLFRMPFNSFDPLVKYADLLFFTWLIIFWLIFRARTDISPDKTIGFSNRFKLNILDYYVVGLIIISLAGLWVVKTRFYWTDMVFEQFFILISLFVGYFIMKDVTRYTKQEVLADFLLSLVVINAIASVLYFLHQGLHIVIYTTKENEDLIEIVDGQIITRSFHFMPVLWFFSVSYLLVFFKKQSLIKLSLLTVTVLGIYISYTRSFLIITLVLFILSIVLTGIRKQNYGNTLKNIFLVCTAGIVLFFTLSSLLPQSTNYIRKRFENLDNNYTDEKSNTFIFRLNRTSEVISKIDPANTLLGYGAVTETQMPVVKIMKAATADLGWTEVIFRWGFLGLTLFILLYISAILKAFLLFMRTEGIMSQLALLLLLTIISQIIEGFTSFTIMSPNRFPLGLWYLGILSGLVSLNRSKQFIQTEHIVSNE